MSSLKQMVERGRIALKAKNPTLMTVAKAMAAEDRPLAPETQPFPALPKKVELDLATRQAMDSLTSVFGNVHPEIRRTLTDAELRELQVERTAIRLVTEPLGKRDEVIKEIVRNHMDTAAESRGVAVPKAKIDEPTGEIIVSATPRDSKGHYVLAAPGKREECPIPGTNVMFTREYRAGTVTVDVESLLAMYEKDQITKEEYLSMTRQTRVIDEGKVWEFVFANPERGLEILGAITTHGTAGTNFNVRKVS